MDKFVRLDKNTWVRPEAVQMVRMGFDHETLIFVGSCEQAFSVDLSITETVATLAANGSRADHGGGT